MSYKKETEKGAAMEKRNTDLDWSKIALFLKAGILGACIILAGDLLMGWGVRDTSLTGMKATLSPYLTISDGKMFWAALFGFTGVPLAVLGHFGIYKLLKPYSRKYALLYAIGILGFLTLGGAGVHVSSVEAAFFYKYMTAADASAALDSTIKFAVYFLLPLYIVLLTCWGVMVYAHLRAITGGLSPFPRWCWVFAMPIGSLLVFPIGLLGNHEIINALMMGAFSIGNIWTLAGHLWVLPKARENWEKCSSDLI